MKLTAGRAMVAHESDVESEGFATSHGFSRLSGQRFDPERVGLCLGTLGKVIIAPNFIQVPYLTTPVILS